MPPVVHYRFTAYSSGPQWSACELRLSADDLATDDPREVTCERCLRATPHVHPFNKGVWPSRCAERVTFHGLQQDCGRSPAHPLHHL